MANKVKSVKKDIQTRTFQEQKIKEKLLEEKRIRKDAEQLARCTFHPILETKNRITTEKKMKRNDKHE